MTIHIKKKNEGKFTKAAKAAGESVQEHARSVLNNPKATKLQKRRAQFAVNAKKFKHEDGGSVHKAFGHRSALDNGWIPTKELKKKHPAVGIFRVGGTPQILQRYTALVDAGINPQTAFDTAHLSLIEVPNGYYSFGKRATDLNGWTKNATDSLTTGRYQNLNNVTNFQQFKQGLKQKNYNSRPRFYNVEINRNIDKHKQIVNNYNSQHGLPLIAGIFTSNEQAV